jgi:SAM-dependent methyltransferase
MAALRAAPQKSRGRPLNSETPDARARSAHAVRDAPSGCPLCAHDVERVLAGHPAYAAPGRFDVYDCGGCDTRFAWPMATSSALYEQIYRVAASLPGYDRYERFRTALPGGDRPLDLLASSEDVYWSVREALAPSLGAGKTPRVLEIGSGMGYLTYALHRAGCDVVGIDHSAEAVGKATATFGPLYRVAPAESLAGSGLGVFDAVIATEVIEHLQDPAAFVRDASALLAPGGRLILTTPNHDLYPRDLAWHTDPAPVHLWWFSKTSLRRIAWSCGLQPSFVDFSAFYGRRRAAAVASKPQSLDAAGQPIFRDSALNTIARGLMARWPGLVNPIARIFLARTGRQFARERFGRESLSLCAVLRKEPGEVPRP